MKTLIKSILVVVMMLGTCVSYANKTLNVSPTYKLVNEGSDISVIDAFGKLIYSGRINYDGNLIRLYDFSKLNNGIYTVEINKAFEIEVIDLEVKNENVRLIAETQEKIFKPIFRTKESKLIISKIALDSKEMDVELYFEDELIYTERVEDKEDVLNRVYTLDKTKRGSYTAIIKTNDRVYIKYFKI